MHHPCGYLNLLKRSQPSRGIILGSLDDAFRSYPKRNLKIEHCPEGIPVKSFDDIPTKRSILPSWLELLCEGGASYLHNHCDKRHKDLGPIFKESLGPIELTFIADTDLFRIILANEGKHPIQNIPAAWTYYNEIHNIERGLFFQFGDSWARMRHAMNKVLLCNEFIGGFTEDIIKINEDLLNFWARSNTPNDDFVITDLKDWLCKWSIETTGFMLYGHRLGCIADSSTNSAVNSFQAGELVRSVSDMFEETSNFQMLPVKLAHRLNLQVWRRFETAYKDMLQVAGDYTSRNLDRLKESDAGGRRSVVRELIDLGELNMNEISRSAVDLLIAAADTTSNSLQWMLYSLAKYPEAQDKILNELDSGDEEKNSPGLRPYLRSFMRESQRLYPTAPFLARTLSTDVTLAGYRVPAGKPLVLSLYTTSRMSAYFDRPQEFMPERWLRSDASRVSGCPRDRNHAHASLPFGFGSRNCIGRRGAELGMSLFIVSLLERFVVSLADEREIGVKLKMILEPERPITIKLRTRPH